MTPVSLRLFTAFAALLLTPLPGATATQGQAGPTSTATAKITLHIYPRRTEDGLQNPATGRLLERGTTGYRAVSDYCRSPSQVNAGHDEPRLSENQNRLFEYSASVTTQFDQSWSARLLLEANCGRRVLERLSATIPTLVIAPI